MTPEERAEKLVWPVMVTTGAEDTALTLELESRRAVKVKKIANAIRAAVAEEREACAKAAEGCQIIVYCDENDVTRVNGEGTRISAAEAIRARTP